MKNKKLMFWMIIALVIAAAVVIIKKPTKLGLDLVGGSRIVLEAQTTDTIAKITPDMMSSLQFAIENRVNALGVAETVVQQTGEKRLLVEIPNISDPAKAKEFLGETAELEFKKPLDNQYGATGWAPTGLTGKDVKKALISTNPGGQWVVSLEFNDKGTKKFGQLTQELVGKPMAIFFNGDMQSAPVIQEPILGGHAQISGGDSGFAYEEAKKMVDLLNAGALPVPAKIIEESLVGPTLGADSIAKSKTAGIIGIGLVMIFMLLYYRLPGAIADVALIIYSLLVFAVFKIVPVTLTLAGIAGFILSIGMAVDANILIFERTKEELKAGRTLFTAINAGFDRAFTSIFDSNMTTIITCVILYFLGTVTKNFMHLLFGAGQLKHPGWFGIKQSEIGKAYEATETKKEKAKFGILD